MDEIAEVVRLLRKGIYLEAGHPQLHETLEIMRRAADILEGQSRDLKGLGRLVDWYQAEYAVKPPSSSDDWESEGDSIEDIPRSWNP